MEDEFKLKDVYENKKVFSHDLAYVFKVIDIKLSGDFPISDNIDFKIDISKYLREIEPITSSHVEFKYDNEEICMRRSWNFSQNYTNELIEHFTKIKNSPLKIDIAKKLNIAIDNKTLEEIVFPVMNELQRDFDKLKSYF